MNTMHINTRNLPKIPPGIKTILISLITTGLISFTGQVKAQWATPGVKSHTGNAKLSGWLTITDNTKGIKLKDNNGINRPCLKYGIAGINGGYDHINLTNRTPNGDLRFMTSGTIGGAGNETTRMTIDHLGNVGIGTLNPSAQFHTTGSVRLATLAGSGNRMVIADADGDLTTLAIPTAASFNSCTTVNQIPKVSNSSGDLICSQIFDTDTFVGIGSLTPGHILHIMDKNSGYAQPQGYGPVLETPSLVVVNGGVGVGNDTSNPEAIVAEFRAQREAVSNAGIKIRGSRDEAITQDIAYLELADYDQNENGGSEFTMSRVSAGMQTGTNQTGYFTIATNEGTTGSGLTQKLFIDNMGNTGIGNSTFSSTSLPQYRLDVMGTMGVEILPLDSTLTKVVVWDSTSRQLHYRDIGSFGIENSCITNNFVPKSDANGDLSCSQIQDDGITVGIGGLKNVYTPTGDTVIFYVNGNSWIEGNQWVTSDQRYKMNVKRIPSALEKIRNLEGVSYDYRTEEYPAIGLPKRRSMGLIAQELEAVIPELVNTSADGYKAVNYDGLLPVLIEAIKEQQSMIEQLQAQVAENNNAPNANAAAINPVLENNEVVLYQNHPNPFSEQTIIEYDLGRQFGSAAIYIYNMNGVQLESYPINDLDKGQVIINGGSLDAGMYFYSLIADGHVIDTKTMILTK